MKAKKPSLLTIAAGLAAGAAAIFFSKPENRKKAINAGKKASAVVKKEARKAANKAKPAIRKAVAKAKPAIKKAVAKKVAPKRKPAKKSKKK